MSREFFEQVADALVGFAPLELGTPHTRLTGGNVKLWFDDSTREHYEAQFLRNGRFEIGFHAEHRATERNEAVLDRLLAHEGRWRNALGDDVTAGEFVGQKGGPWRRLSELIPAPDIGDPEAALEVADRLATYVEALEPIRASA